MMLAIAMIYDDINKDISLDKNWPHIKHEVALWESTENQKRTIFLQIFTLVQMGGGMTKSKVQGTKVADVRGLGLPNNCNEYCCLQSSGLSTNAIKCNIVHTPHFECVCIAFVCNVFAYAFAFQLNVFAFAFVCNVFAFALLLYLNLPTLLQLTSNKSGFNSCGLENLTMCTTLQFNSFELIWGLLIW